MQNRAGTRIALLHPLLSASSWTPPAHGLLTKLSTITILAILALLLGACPGGGGSGANPFVDPASGGSGQAVSLSITSPASGSSLETPDKTVVLAGTASSNVDIVAVTWANDKGGEGNASGGESWETDSIPLELGKNRITITARDSAGATASKKITVKRESGGTGSVTLSWSAPTTREDGTALTDLAGYSIHYGRMSETYDYEIKIDNPGVTTYVVENLSSGTWYFVASAYDSSDLESNFSNEISRDVP